jgi:hypothetical protein
MAEPEMPNPSHPAWQKICPFSNMTHATCNVPDVPEGLSPAHIGWHAERMVEVGEWQVAPGVGADDPDHVAYRLKEHD